MRLFVVAALLLASCGWRQPRPDGGLTGDGLPAGIYCVVDDCSIIRGPQLTAAQFAIMVAKYHIKSVIKLNVASLPFDGGHDVLPDGVEEYHHPWSPVGPVTHEQTADAIADLIAAPKPVYTHCVRGEDRTGYLIAMYRVKVQHVLPFAAYGEWRHFGRDMSLFAFSESFFKETGWHE